MLSEIEQQALQALADRNGGVLHPQTVIDAARDPDSPLHRFFTWDVETAARERWVDQACQLIRKYRVDVTTRSFDVTVPAFIRDPESPRERNYISIGRLQTDEERARCAIVAEFHRAAAAVRRAKDVALALGLGREVSSLHRQIEELIGIAESKAHKRPPRSAH